MNRLILSCLLVVFCFLPVYAAPAKQNAKSAWDKVVVLETTQGKIELQLLPKVAPLACENFVRLVRKGYYNGITFHRVIKGFMIQGGDPNGTGSGGKSIWGKPFKNEVSSSVIFNRTGLLAMANAGPDTNGSQFFITTGVERTSHLTGGYTIFGKVISGMETVKKIESTKTNESDRPLTTQIIKKAYIKGEIKK